MLRRFNQTGRDRIHTEHVGVQIRSADEQNVAICEITIDLSSYDFAPDSAVRVEAWRGNISQRWDLGEAGQLGVGARFQRPMSEAPDQSQFKVVVVAADGSGKLLGASAAIKPKMPVESLIPLTPTDLGEEVWKVSFGETNDGLPDLLVNNRIERISEEVRSDEKFRSLVMPQVLRSVLSHIIFVLGGDEDDDEAGWYLDWFRLAKSVAPGDIPKVTDRSDQSQLEAAQEWIDRVVEEFAAKKVHAAELYRSVQDNS